MMTNKQINFCRQQFEKETFFQDIAFKAYSLGFERGLNYRNNKGKWLLSKYQNEDDVINEIYTYECSNCGATDSFLIGRLVNYCWNCGAKMEMTKE